RGVPPPGNVRRISEPQENLKYRFAFEGFPARNPPFHWSSSHITLCGIQLPGAKEVRSMTSQPTLTKPGSSPAGPGESGGTGLQAGLKNRHLSMIAIGGVIGAGLFVGSKSAIATAGPGILLSYALVGTLVVLVMRMLGEMSAAHPTSGSFSAHA